MTAVCAGFLVVRAVDVLILMLVAFFIAVGLHPAVTWLTGRGLPYPFAATVVVVGVVLLVAGFLAAALVPLVDQADQLARQLGDLANTVRDQDSFLGRLNQRFGLERQLRGSANARTAVEAITGVFVVLVLTIYFLADFRRIRAALYRLVPARRRPRAILIGDQIYARIGAYLLGNLLVSVVAGVVSFASLVAFGVPYALFLAIVVAVLDLVPLVGTLVAAVAVAAVALTVTVVAVLLGGVLAGVAGALVSIPVAAAALLIVREVSFPWLDRT